jgi:phosphate transport system permease protein
MATPTGVVNSSTRGPVIEGRAAPPGRLRVFVRRLRAGDEIAHLITLTFAASIFLLTVLLVYELYHNSALSRHKFGFAFFFTRTWDPVFENFGALPFIYGTVVTSALALLIAVPLGVGAAIFLAELAPPGISSALTFVIELLAAVPSVIYGLLGIFILVPVLRTYVEPSLKYTLGFVPLFQGPVFGLGFLAAGVVLAIMVVPFIISVSREVLLAVPNDQREAALALGATRWESTWKVVVPYAKIGIIGSIFLSLARALGETMAVTMVIGNTPQIAASLFAPGYSIAAVIANEFTEATGELYVQSLIELGLVLFLLTILINGLARLLIMATTRKSG